MKLYLIQRCSDGCSRHNGAITSSDMLIHLWVDTGRTYVLIARTGDRYPLRETCPVCGIQCSYFAIMEDS
jgi:hypothetical protein